MRLENWFYTDGCISGEVYGSTSEKDGVRVVTQEIVYVDKNVATTKWGQKYVLGKPLSIDQSIQTIDTLILSVENWAEERGIFENSTTKDQALKTMSEVGEFADNVLKGRDVRDDIGDIIVTLILQCRLQNTTLQECLQLAYDEISNRKGKMVNGAFVKEGD